MILQQLYQDATRILKSTSPSMYDTKPVRWVVRLDGEGNYLDIIPLPGKRGTPRIVPYVGRTVGIRPILLADSPAYVFGYALDDKRASDKHAAFKSLVAHCAKETQDKSVLAVNCFLSQWSLNGANLPEEMAAGDLVTFEVNEQSPTESMVVQEYWARLAKGETQDKKVGVDLQCLVTGRIGPVELSLPGLIKGIPDGQPSGTAIVSANAAAFESHGLERARTSPISREAAERFTKALNFLIANERYRYYISGLVYVYWTRKSEEDEDYFSFLKNPDEDEVKKLLASPHIGKLRADFDEFGFFALSLSASGGRAVVRDWISTTIANAREKLVEWFKAQEIVDRYGKPGPHYSIKSLAISLYRDLNAKIETRVTRALVRYALNGDPIPMDLLYKAVNRNRVEQVVTRNRASLIKTVLISQRKEKLMPELDVTNTNHAYVCGRLLAVLEVVQRAAVGSVNTTLTDRYFGAASTTPATVFGVLMAQANKAHFPKIRRTKPGAYHVLQSRIAEIISEANLTEFPRMLKLHEQGLFALGYYQQRASDSAAVQAAKERKKRGEASEQNDLADIDDIAEKE